MHQINSSVLTSGVFLMCGNVTMTMIAVITLMKPAVTTLPAPQTISSVTRQGGVYLNHGSVTAIMTAGPMISVMSLLMSVVSSVI